MHTSDKVASRGGEELNDNYFCLDSGVKYEYFVASCKLVWASLLELPMLQIFSCATQVPWTYYKGLGNQGHAWLGQSYTSHTRKHAAAVLPNCTKFNNYDLPNTTRWSVPFMTGSHVRVFLAWACMNFSSGLPSTVSMYSNDIPFEEIVISATLAFLPMWNTSDPTNLNIQFLRYTWNVHNNFWKWKIHRFTHTPSYSLSRGHKKTQGSKAVEVNFPLKVNWCRRSYQQPTL